KSSLSYQIVKPRYLRPEDEQIVENVIKAPIKATISIGDHIKSISVQKDLNGSPGEVLKVSGRMEQAPVVLFESGIETVYVSGGDRQQSPAFHVTANFLEVKMRV